MSETSGGSGTSTVDAGANGTVVAPPEAPASIKVGDKVYTVEQVQRYAEIARGVGDYAPALKVMREKGLDPKVVAATLAGSIGTEPGEDATPEAKPTQAPDVTTLVNQELDRRELANTERAHLAAINSQYESVATQVRNELRGLDAEAIQAAVDTAQAEYNRKLTDSKYHDGHPLANKYHAPLGSDGLAAVVKTATDRLKKFGVGAKAAAFSAIGKVAATTTSTPAGAAPGQGTKPSGPMTRAEQDAETQAVISSVQARRRGG